MYVTKVLLMCGLPTTHHKIFNLTAMFMTPMKPDVPKYFTSPEQNRDLWTSYHL